MLGEKSMSTTNSVVWLNPSSTQSAASCPAHVSTDVGRNLGPWKVLLGGNYGVIASAKKKGAFADVLRPRHGSFSQIERRIKQNTSFPFSSATMELSISAKRTHAASRDQKKLLRRLQFERFFLTQVLLQKVKTSA